MIPRFISKGSPKWAGMGKAEPRVLYTKMQKERLHQRQAHMCRDKPTEQAWKVVSQIGDIQDLKTKEKGRNLTAETTIWNENENSSEWAGRAEMGHRLRQKSHWSHLNQYWNREDIVNISVIEILKLRRKRGRGQTQWSGLLSSMAYLHFFPHLLPVEWSSNGLGWFWGLSYPGPPDLTSLYCLQIIGILAVLFAHAVPAAWQVYFFSILMKSFLLKSVSFNITCSMVHFLNLSVRITAFLTAVHFAF